MSDSDFSSDERSAVYKAILGRRDIRMYRPESIPEDVLIRILRAGHAAGSVGMMQPWNFIVLDDVQKRTAVHRHFVECNERAAAVWSDERQVHYGIEMQGILDSPSTSSPVITRGGEQVLGRHTIPETDIYSTRLAVQNMWLAAARYRHGLAQHYGGRCRKNILDIPDHVSTIAYMTVDIQWSSRIPLLEAVGWKQRTDLTMWSSQTAGISRTAPMCQPPTLHLHRHRRQLQTLISMSLQSDKPNSPNQRAVWDAWKLFPCTSATFNKPLDQS